MFLGDNRWTKKIFYISLFFCLFLSFLFIVFSPSFVSAASVSPSSYSLYYTGYNAGWAWRDNFQSNTVITPIPDAVSRYTLAFNSINFTGNFGHFHSETNFVMSQPSSLAYLGDFRNLDTFFLSYCGSQGHNLTVRSYNISTAVTPWNGNTPAGINAKNITLTVYLDVVFSDFVTGSHDFYCSVYSGGTSQPFYQVTSSTNVPHLYIEQSPSQISFTTDYSEALQREQNAILNNINNSLSNIDNSLNNQESDYDKEKADLDAKESELESDVDNFSLTAPIPTNNLFRFFRDPFNDYNQRCFTTATLHTLFNVEPILICSIFTSNVRVFIRVASNFVLLALILRLYFKKMKGGFNG